MRDYVAILEHSHACEKEWSECAPESRLEFLSLAVFDFTTYESGMDALFARKAVEVCKAINERTTFDYIKSEPDYLWFIQLCNMPFFADRITWGTSIRGAFWDGGTVLRSCSLWENGEQVMEIEFNREEWVNFVSAVVRFAEPEMI